MVFIVFFSDVMLTTHVAIKETVGPGGSGLAVLYHARL
jgi:hypothetical protein